MNQSKLMFTNKQNSYKIKRSQKGSFLLCLLTWEEGMEKTFIMSVKKKYEVHVTTDLNCEETYAPEGDNTIDLEKNLENIISFFIYPIYLIYNFLYTNFHSIIIFIYVIGMATSDLRISILVSVFSLFLTCSLLSKFEWTHIEFCILINISFALLTSIILIRLSPYITMPKWLKFLSLNNLGNTITYICIMITLIDLAIGNNHKY